MKLPSISVAAVSQRRKTPTAESRHVISGGGTAPGGRQLGDATVHGALLVARASANAPLFDFPNIRAGRRLAIVTGSRVGLLAPKGTVNVDRLEGNVASFSMNATAVGQSARFQMTIERVDAGHVRITSKNAKTGSSQMVVGTIVSTKQNYAQFQASDGSGKTTVYQNPAGHIVIDTTIPGYGAAHLILQ
ncbi:MAG: hypothetical protein JWN41_451 [Thermoleophilia bacterium]|nr:hypothetical protein [Thermoleophilia bacterium]